MARHDPNSPPLGKGKHIQKVLSFYKNARQEETTC